MAHYAFIDENNIVVNVIVGVDENEIIDGKTPEEYYSEKFGMRCLRTSFNGNIRKNFAGIGMIYDERLDAFLHEQIFPSWILNEETGKWEPPIPRPDWTIPHFWNEDTGKWELEPYFKNSVTIESRVFTCLECPFWIPETTSCSQCGCSGKHLHTNPNAVCPEGKW